MARTNRGNEKFDRKLKPGETPEDRVRAARIAKGLDPDKKMSHAGKPRSEKPGVRRTNLRPNRPAGQEGQRGAITLYDPVRHPHAAKVLCEFHGFTIEQLAQVFGVSDRTIKHWKQVYEDFREACREGMDAFDSDRVEQALLKRALGYEYKKTTVKKTFIKGRGLDANGDPCDYKLPAREVTITKEQVAADVKAITFWLTNRQDKRWKMKADTQININSTSTTASIAMTANLEELDTEQLMALRDMVANQVKDEAAQIEHKIIDNGILERASRVKRGEVLDADYEVV